MSDLDPIRSYRVVLLCGGVPVAVGSSIFVLWWITRWEWLMMAGLGTIFGGILLLLVGSVFLIRFGLAAARTPDFPGRRLRRYVLAGAALLLVNLPAAAAFTAAAVLIETRYVVVVNNAMLRPLESVSVSGGGSHATLGTIPAGGSAQCSLWIRHDGELELWALDEGTPMIKTIDGYVTNGLGGLADVTVQANGTLSVRRGDR
jgi:hypothetical protein